MNTLKYNNDCIILNGFDQVKTEMTFLFFDQGVSVVPGLKKQKETNYPLMVNRQDDRIVIRDKDLIDILVYLNIPGTIEFMSCDDGYIAYIGE